MMQFDQVETALIADLLEKNSTFVDQATYLTYRALSSALSEFEKVDDAISQHQWSEALTHLRSAADWTRRMWWSKLDTTRPVISTWGIEGNISQGEPYRVWASVEDNMAGVENVSVIVRNPNYFVVKPLLNQNGTHWVVDLPALSINGTWEFWIESYDWAMNVASSFSQTVDYSSIPVRTIDPSETLVVVVASSVGIAAVTIVLALLYDRRRLASSA
jgi:hypothetical protein